MVKTIFIGGTSHSGSTLLELLLSGHSKISGLGEIHQILHEDGIYFKDHIELPCSCGSNFAHCVFWSEYKKCAAAKESYIERYSALQKLFEEVTQCHIMVDSSKYVFALQHTIPVINDVLIIHLIKDVRAWTVSMKNLVQPEFLESEKDNDNFLNTYYFMDWYKQNKRWDEFLQKGNINYLQIGYEELCHDPEKILTMICDAIGLEFEKAMLIPNNSNSHIVAGNYMARDNNKRAAIRYDMRWYEDVSLPPVSNNLEPIILLNRRLVYGIHGGKEFREWIC